MIHRKRRTDHNQSETVTALQKAGYHVTDLSGCGGGVPDLLVTKRKHAYLIEIKNPKGRNRFTPQQIEFYAAVQLPVFVLRSINDVESWIKGEIRPINTYL